MSTTEKTGNFEGKYVPKNEFHNDDDGYHILSTDGEWMYSLDSLIPDEAKTENSEGQFPVGTFVISVTFTPKETV